MRIGAWLLVVVGAVLTGLACAPTSVAQADKFDNAKTFAADALPYSRAELILAGTSLPVTLDRQLIGDVLTMQLVAHGDTIEEEKYETDSLGFRVLSACGEIYRPAIPLVRFPLTVGDGWTWQGTADAEGTSHEAEASVETRREMLNVTGGPYNTVRVIVEITLKNNQAEPTRRRLDVWFAPSHGIVKRQFGAGSTRGPLAATAFGQ